MPTLLQLPQVPALAPDDLLLVEQDGTAAVASEASPVEDVIAELAATRITERGASRADDKFSEAAMEDRKREGYF